MLFFVEDVIFLVGEDIIDIIYGLFGDLNFDEVYGFEESGCGEESRGVQDMMGSGDDLIVIMVNGISVEGNIEDVEVDRVYGFFSNGIFMGSLLEIGDNRVFDFVQVLNGFGLVNK